MHVDTTAQRQPVPSIQRLDDALVLTGDAVGTVRWVLSVAISARRRGGLSVPREVGQLAGLLTGHGQKPTATEGFGQSRGDVIGVGELARLLGCSHRHARRIAPELGRLEAGRWVIDRNIAEQYARSRTA
ncbi:hypothetical protein [Rhodococcus rhodochrous]|uniref:Helix-turn-helix domain-containing protein n=1 Tax=Rhodococcus rhodochrous TaxID=1829 RepID=A0AA46WVV7_RHORH|nr:hypothetical protein [Rhodococcus rhodochrous]UZF45371.1 hypothetical protein KUM34_001250 [Rhodococcus rhodochrous]